MAGAGQLDEPAAAHGGTALNPRDGLPGSGRGSDTSGPPPLDFRARAHEPGDATAADATNCHAQVMPREFELDGSQFSTLEEFFAHLDPILLAAGLVGEDHRTSSVSAGWSLMVLDEALTGWFNPQSTDEAYWPAGMPDSFTIRWKQSDLSRRRLGYQATIAANQEALSALRKRGKSELWSGLRGNLSSTKKRLRKEIRSLKRAIGPTL